MAQQGDVLENPFTGQVLTFRLTAADTEGELLEVESSWAATGGEPPEHYHPHQEERFEVLEGELRARVADEERPLRAGDVLEVPAATPHTMWNPGPGRARAIWQTRPALKTESFFELVWGLAHAAQEGADDRPSPDEVAAMLQEYEHEYRLGRPGQG